jgi:hypothetical protein
MAIGTYWATAHRQIFSKEILYNILFCNHYYSPLNTFIRKGKDPDPHADPGGSKTYGSGTLFLHHANVGKKTKEQT